MTDPVGMPLCGSAARFTKLIGAITKKVIQQLLAQIKAFDMLTIIGPKHPDPLSVAIRCGMPGGNL